MKLFTLFVVFFMFHAPVFAFIDSKIVHEENNKGIIEFAKLSASAGGQYVEEDWGIMTKTAPGESNIGFDFIFITKNVNEKQIKDILAQCKKFFKNTFFEIWIDKNNSDHRPIFEKNGFKNAGLFPARYLSLDKAFDDFLPHGIDVKKVVSEKELNDWVDVTTKIYNLNQEKLMNLFKSVFKKTHVSLYVAYHDSVPISARMMIRYGKTVTGYFSATIPDYRRKGIASCLLRYSLNEARKEGATLFVNQSSPTSAIMWKKMGMHDYDNIYECYIKAS